MHKEVPPPMLGQRVYVEQINIKVNTETKKQAQLLKGYGVDTSELFRNKIMEAIDDAFKILDAEAVG